MRLRSCRPARCLPVAVACALSLALTGSASATPGEVVTYPLPPERRALAIATGPDGNMWFTQSGHSAIVRITPSGEITEFPFSCRYCSPKAIALGPDGNLWFTLPHALGKITPEGQVDEVQLPEDKGAPQGIARGPDGNMWFTLSIGSEEGPYGEDTAEGRLGRIAPSGQITEFSLPSESGAPRSIVSGPDGNLWFTKARAARIGRLTPTGQVTEFRLPRPTAVGDIAAGPDGNLWFTEAGAEKIGRIAPTGEISEFPLPAGSSRPAGIAAGPDGNLWFGGSGAISRITPGGQITAFRLPPSAGSTSVAAGPDGNVWFASHIEGERYSFDQGKIARIEPGGLGIEVADTRAFVRRGWVRLTLSCAGGGGGSACRGTLRLTSEASRHRPFHMPTIAHRRYSLPSGTQRRVAVRLRRRGLAQLARHRLLMAHATATASGGQAGSRLVALRMRPPRRPRPGQVIEFPLAGGWPSSIAAGPDGNLWFTESDDEHIGRISPRGRIAEFQLPTEHAGLGQIATGPEGSLWFTEPKAGKIGRITPTGQVSELPLPSWHGEPGWHAEPRAIAAGPEGNVWFTRSRGSRRLSRVSEHSPARIGRITPTGEVIEFPLPNPESEPRGIVAGPDGNLWFIVSIGMGSQRLAIGRITPAGELTEFPVEGGQGWPGGIAAGPDGNVWFTTGGIFGRHVGRITPRGRVTLFAIPSRSSVSSAIAPGPDGNLWFTERSSAKVARVTPHGQITVFPLSMQSGVPAGIAAGPDGNLWFTQSRANRISFIAPGALGIEVGPSRAFARRGWTRIWLACAGGRPRSLCRGRVRLTTEVRRWTGPSSRWRTRVVLARRLYRLRSGRRKSIAVRLNRRALDLLFSRYPHRLTVMASAGVRGGFDGSRRIDLRRAPVRASRTR
jgi:streptogramin lyase